MTSDGFKPNFKTKNSNAQANPIKTGIKVKPEVPRGQVLSPQRELMDASEYDFYMTTKQVALLTGWTSATVCRMAPGVDKSFPFLNFVITRSNLKGPRQTALWYVRKLDS